MSNKRRTVPAVPRPPVAVENDEGSPWVGPDGVTYSSKDEFYAAAVATEKADGFPAWFPAGMRKGSHGQGLLLTRLVADAAAVYELEAATVRDVADARALGASWQLVGLALGISAEGARSRYGRAGRSVAKWEEAASDDDD